MAVAKRTDQAWLDCQQRAKRRQADASLVAARAAVRAAKDRPCADCGGSFPHFVMDFDHVRGEKLYTISQLVRGKVSRAKMLLLLAEIEKCDVVCANCHRVRTHG